MPNWINFTRCSVSEFVAIAFDAISIGHRYSMFKTHVSTSFLCEVTGLSICFGPAFSDLNTKQSLRGNYSKSLQFAQNSLAWEHGLTSAWVCTFISCRSWWSTQPSHSHPCCFSSSGAAEMEGLEIFSTSPPTYSHFTFSLLLKQKGKVSQKRKQLPKEDISVDNKEKKLVSL